MQKLSRIAAALVLSLSAAAHAADYVWWEGETPFHTNFPKSSAFAPAKLAKPEVLSNQNWLSIDGKRTGAAPFATYRVTVPAAGDYHLWCRKFWKHGPFTWKFGNDAPRECGRDVALADASEIQKFVGANWVYLGKVHLEKGVHNFRIELTAKEGEPTTAAFDCFILTPGAFLPNGKLKPGETVGKAEPGFFPFEPPLDRFGNEALLDLRGMNEPMAGAKGFVRREGDRFVTGDAKEVRFWAVNVGAENIGQNRESIDYLARRLAKLGVNMVRFHSSIVDEATPARIDPKKLDNLHYFVAAMKREGIYTGVSIYFPLWFDAEKALGLTGYKGMKNNKPFAVVMFDQGAQAVYRSWAEGMLRAKNPYTGVPLAQEPALAMVELQNEDSFFFWTFGEANVPAEKWADLERLFAADVAKVYGSAEKALAAWGGFGHKHDDPAGKRLGLFDAWHMTADGFKNNPRKQKRMADQVRFLAQTQRGFYHDMTRYLKDDLKYGGMVVASNWHVADARTLDALERWTYTAGDVIDRHGYFNGKHEGDGASFSVREGHTYEDRAPVLHPEGMPFHGHQVAGYPHIVSELGYTQPNRYRSDATTIAAAYGALQGIDGLYFFAVGSNYVRDNGIVKFQVASPAVAGTFPAAALLYRRGDVSEGTVVVDEQVNLKDLFALRGSAGVAPQALDALRAVDVPAHASMPRADFDPLAFLVGRTQRRLESAASSLAQEDLSRHINRAGKTVTSANGQLTWNFGDGLLRINTPRTQGAAGFLGKAGKVALPALTIESRNEYGSVLLTALDDLPLTTSKRMLLQVMTEERPLGFAAADGKITNLGTSPMGVRLIDATVTIGTGLTIQPLDGNGYAAGAAIKPEGARFPLKPDALYYVITR